MSLTGYCKPKDSYEEMMKSIIAAQEMRSLGGNANLLICIEKLLPEARKVAAMNKGRRTDLITGIKCNHIKGRGAPQIIGMALKVSYGQIEKAIRVIKTPEYREMVLAGKLTINQACEKIIGYKWRMVVNKYSV